MELAMLRHPRLRRSVLVTKRSITHQLDVVAQFVIINRPAFPIVFSQAVFIETIGYCRAQSAQERHHLFRRFGRLSDFLKTYLPVDL